MSHSLAHSPCLVVIALCRMFQKFLLEEHSLHYGEFMNDLAKLMVRGSQPERERGVTRRI